VELRTLRLETLVLNIARDEERRVSSNRLKVKEGLLTFCLNKYKGLLSTVYDGIATVSADKFIERDSFSAVSRFSLSLPLFLSLSLSLSFRGFAKCAKVDRESFAK